MASEAFEIWRDDILSRLPGADEDMADAQFLSALREFYTRSGAWIQEFTKTLQAGKTNYTLNPAPNSSKVIAVHQVQFGDANPVKPASRRPLVSSSAGTGTSGFLPHMSTPSLMIVYPTPATGMADVTMRILASCTYDDGDCHTPPEQVQVQFYDFVLDGALGRMMTIPKKPWSSPVHAQYHLRRFRDGIAVARDMAKRSWGLSESNFQFPQDWARTTRTNRSFGG